MQAHGKMLEFNSESEAKAESLSECLFMLMSKNVIETVFIFQAKFDLEGLIN